MKVRISEKKLVKIIENLIKEQLDTENRYESGSFTHGANELILFADNTSEVYEYAKKHKNVGKVFNFALKTYNKKFEDGLQYDDLETLFYDFAAHYEFPEED
jgi:hypothetical protein